MRFGKLVSAGRVNQARGMSTLDRGVIVAASRTPIGAFSGVLASKSAPYLAGRCIDACIKQASAQGQFNASDVQELFVGSVLSAGMGQAPASQAAIEGNLPWTTVTTAVNKVCSSGMKTIISASQTVATRTQEVVLAGGMESMSRAPFLLPLSARNGFKYGSQSISDSVLLDGLTDPWDLHHMGVCAEHCAKEFGISREAQDTYAAESYKRAIAAQDRGDFANEIVPVSVTKRGKTTKVDADEEPKKCKFRQNHSTSSCIHLDWGTVTAANASTLSDGAAAVLVTSTEFASKHGIKPMAQILGYGEASQKSLLFPTAPSLAIPLALERAGVDKADVDLWEINEAFAVVTLANIKLLNLDPAKVNVNGGAVSLGHPLGASGCRIVVTLLHALIQRNLSIGVAAICNGGGGASAIVVKRL